MKRILLILLLILNLLYLAVVLTGYPMRFSFAWNVGLAFGWIGCLLLSGIFFIRSGKKSGYSPYLSLAVFSLSLACFGWHAFINYLSLIMG
ncbi:hypothetical protein [Halobacillus sp. A5]|uniref:hypothetical protein n=1 Tax=Halobacillus sp. A5 TaxID=2880263 RepID=UPI0020A64F26|nr:hypothetical protein [Halobacillus sp. A5]MCP3027090.1 hypothetical protein [Halobacillus sp. A5]